MQIGLACPRCGSVLNSVKETRQRNNTITRRRVCFNNHTFTTEEIVKHAKHRRTEISKSALRLLAQGTSVKDTAAKVGASVDTVYRIKRGQIAKRKYLPKPSVRINKGTSNVSQ